MRYSPELMQELDILCRFDLDTTQHGIKVHSDAQPELIAAAERLYHKGLLTQDDGGYLTGLGRDAALHAQTLLQILSAE